MLASPNVNLISLTRPACTIRIGEAATSSTELDLQQMSALLLFSVLISIYTLVTACGYERTLSLASSAPYMA
jgi:hypothetical protein